MSEYIKKEDLFNKTIKRNSIWNMITNAEGKGLEEIVNDLPTFPVPEREKGEWVKIHPLQANDGGAYACSICYSGDYGCEKDKFCRWCGADMRT